MNSTVIFLLSLLAFSFAQTSLFDVIQSNPRLTTLTSAIQAAGLEEALSDETVSFTVFAPSDAAFQRFPQGQLDRLLADPDQLSQLLLGHVVPQVITSGDIQNNQVVQSQASFAIRTNVYDVDELQIVTVNGVVVEEVDIEASNGVIHIIDGVMNFQTITVGQIIETDPQFSQLSSVIDRLALQDTLNGGTFTVFAPTDEAFAALPNTTVDYLFDPANEELLRQLILFHVSEEVFFSPALGEDVNVSTLLEEEGQVTGTFEIEGVEIVRPDILAVNGVVHALGGFMIPSLDILTTLRLLDTARLVEFLEVTGLNTTIEEAENLTIFAPNDEAIQLLGVETLQQLQQNPELLTQVLTCHTLPREVFSTDFEDDLVIEEREGCRLRLNIYESQNDTIYTVNGVEVVRPDINSTNGVIHIISRVLPIPQRSLQEALEDLGLTFLANSVNRLSGQKGFMDQLEGFTLFAPTNEAFATLSSHFQNSLQENPVLLQEVLGNHILPRTWFSVGLTDNTTLTTVQEETIQVSVEGRTILLNENTQVVLGDQIVTNGVIHVVDSVLLPEGFQMAPFGEFSGGVATTVSLAVGAIAVIAAILF